MVKLIKHCFKWIIALAAIQALSACQYMTLYNEVTDPRWANADTRPDFACQAIGGQIGDSSLDWCIASEEANRPQVDPSSLRWQSPIKDIETQYNLD